MPSNYNGRGGPKKIDGKITENYRDACPPHKVKDLDALVKHCKGDEAKIRARITEWWEEPAIEEPQWENVGKANKPKEQVVKPAAFQKKEKPMTLAAGGGGDREQRGGVRGDSGGRVGGEKREERPAFRGGRGDGFSRKDGRGAGRGGGGGGRNSDRDRSRGRDVGAGVAASASSTAHAGTASLSLSTEDPNETRVYAEQILKISELECSSPTAGIPTPVSNVQAPKGAWGSGHSFAAVASASSSAPKPKHQPSSPVDIPATQSAPRAPPVAQVPVAAPKARVPVMEPEEEVQIDLGGPMPSGMLSSTSPTAPPPSMKPTGNVWGSKGGAHLIQAEKKPVLPAAPAPLAASLPLSPEGVEPPEEQEPEFSPEPEKTLDNSFISLGSVLPPSVNGANINASGWEPIETAAVDHTSQQQQTMVPSPVLAIPAPIMPVPEPVALPTTLQAVPPAAPAKPNIVLNMGHWETGDGDDDLDFGFGSYDNDTEETTNINSSANASLVVAPTSVPHASPARPPPGLSMPPMPAGAMLVHELENELEAAVLAPKNDNSSDGSIDQTHTQSLTQPQLFMNPPGMPQYGGMGMYGIPPPGMHNGLASMPPAQFGQLPLDTGLNQLNNSRIGNPPSQLNQAGQQQPQQGQYGIQSASSAATNSGAPSSIDSSNGATAPGMPPGMPPSMQGYPSPAYMYAAGGVPGQFNQMGHPAYGMQAPYGYAQQFAPQGQYGGYNQGLMGQGGGYGAPQHYDDQRGGGPRGGGNMRDDHQGGGGGGYNKGNGRGGYRGNRNQHQNSHQTGYGNNYGPTNPNLGYSSMPQYGGYGHGGGYGNHPGGPAGMDPYAMQQQQQGGVGGYGAGGGGFNHPDNDHKKSLGGGPNHLQQQAGGGFQHHQSHLHQQQAGLHQGMSNDAGGGGASGGGGWPGARQQQQNWGGDWQQDN